MQRNNQIKSLVFFSQTGCLLPILIMMNLFFGWMFLPPLTWLVAEGVLIMLFLINSFFVTRKIVSLSSRRGGVIDVEGKVVADNKDIPKIE